MKDPVDQVTGEILFSADIATQPPFIRSAYNYDMDAASIRTGLSCPEPTKTQQQFAEEADINTIVERFGLTGELPSNLKVPQSGDFSEVVSDYQTALNMVLEADHAFMQLPAEVRARFRNDPGELVDFVSDEKNRDEAIKLGLVVPPKAPPDPIRVRVEPEPEVKK